MTSAWRITSIPWVPFVEVGNVSSGYNTATTDDRQTRLRVGLGYNF
ncbi:oligogalacturonate-specific porin KdgM family protein [Enterobacter hormaechei]